jgi:hypothetical protein
MTGVVSGHEEGELWSMVHARLSKKDLLGYFDKYRTVLNCRMEWFSWFVSVPG